MLALTVAAAGLLVFEPPGWLTAWTTVFLGILFEALPFLLAGVLASASVQIWLPARTLRRLAPAGRLRGALTGVLLGVAVPVCECGVVPLARRMLERGAGLPMALGLLLAGPVVNPVVFLATWTALGPEMAAARLVIAFGVALSIAWLYGHHPRPASLLRVDVDSTMADGHVHDASDAPRWLETLTTAGRELRDLAPYLVVGAAMAAMLRTVIPGTTLATLGEGPVISVVLMMALAALLSICSAVDAFVALSFSGSVSTGALLAFLVFGPVIDIKSVILYGAIFRTRTVMMFALLVTQLVLLVGITLNMHVG
jgi:uncharacterized protein